MCLDPKELRRFLKMSIVNWGSKGEDLMLLQQRTYFYFSNKLFYCHDGNIIVWNLRKKKDCMKELNFKSAIREFFMTEADSDDIIARQERAPPAMSLVFRSYSHGSAGSR